GARLGRRQHAGREVTALTGPTLVPLISPRKRESSKISWVPAYAGRAVKVAKRPSLRRDRFEPAFGHRRPEHADHDKNNRHRAGNEAEYPDGAVTGEKERDDEAGEDRREPAPRIDEADRLGADAGRIELRLIGVKRKRHPIIA